MDALLGTDLGISGGGEQTGHSPGSRHYTLEAADISYRMNPGLADEPERVMSAAKTCGFGFGLVEKDHYHVQIPAGRRGGEGDLPDDILPLFWYPEY